MSGSLSILMRKRRSTEDRLLPNVDDTEHGRKFGCEMRRTRQLLVCGGHY